MIKTNTSSQNTATVPSRDDYLEKLYTLIRRQVKRERFPRRMIENNEVVNECFIQLSQKVLPNFKSSKFRNLLRGTIKHVVRHFEPLSFEMIDFDELNHDEHPFYEMNFFCEDEIFEFVFAKFCETFSEPKRTVYSHSLILSRSDIAELTGLSRGEIAQLLRKMPEHFEKFYTKFSDDTTTQ